MNLVAHSKPMSDGRWRVDDLDDLGSLGAIMNPFATADSEEHAELIVRSVNSFIGIIGESKCFECGELYQPTRKPAYNRKNYCRDCGNRASDRNSQRSRRAKARFGILFP